MEIVYCNIKDRWLGALMPFIYDPLSSKLAVNLQLEYALSIEKT